MSTREEADRQRIAQNWLRGGQYVAKREIELRVGVPKAKRLELHGLRTRPADDQAGHLTERPPHGELGDRHPHRPFGSVGATNPLAGWPALTVTVVPVVLDRSVFAKR